MENIIELLNHFKPIQKNGYIELKLPVVMRIYDACLTLYLTENKDGYIISDNGETFYDFNRPAKYYYDLFIEKNVNKNFEINFSKNFIYKKYSNNFNINVAINEFIRFFISLDDFILDNNLT